MRYKELFAAALFTAILPACRQSKGQEVGSVDTAFNLVGSNHKIVSQKFDDPKVEGVRIVVTKAVTGGVGAMIGMAENPSEFTIGVVQTGPVKFKEALPGTEEVVSERMAQLFSQKEMHITRMWDPNDHFIQYIVTSDKLVDGSPKHGSFTFMPMPWEGKAPEFVLTPPGQ